MRIGGRSRVTPGAALRCCSSFSAATIKAPEVAATAGLANRSLVARSPQHRSGSTPCRCSVADAGYPDACALSSIATVCWLRCRPRLPGAAGGNLRVDAEHLAVHVEQRTAVEVNCGGPGNPLSDEELARKFHDNAVRSLPEERAAELAARTLAVPDAQSVEDLTALLTSARER